MTRGISLVIFLEMAKKNRNKGNSQIRDYRYDSEKRKHIPEAGLGEYDRPVEKIKEILSAHKKELTKNFAAKR